MKTLTKLLCCTACFARALTLIISPSAEAAPLLLSHFKFNGDGYDYLSNSPPMTLSGVSFTNGTIRLPADTFYSAVANISGFSYSSFTVALDFNPCDVTNYSHSTILSGGPAYRWLNLEIDGASHLVVRLNNGSLVYWFTNQIVSNSWHTLVCSIDLPTQRIYTFLDGKLLPDIFLQNFQFEVVGTSFEASDKAFSFRNHGTGTQLCGYVDNLRIYSRSLSPPEIDSIFTVGLSLRLLQNDVGVYWPVDLTGYILESANSLSPSATWQNVAVNPFIIGDQRLMIEPASGTMRFYRLKRQ